MPFVERVIAEAKSRLMPLSSGAKLTVKVIDTIPYEESFISRYPELAHRGVGLLLILDPQEIRGIPNVEGKTITVTKPNGESIELVGSGTQGAGSVSGIFFPDMTDATVIPKGSTVSW